MLNEKLQKTLAKADKLLLTSAKSGDWLAFFTPQNLVSERQTFLKKHSLGIKYEPRFAYKSLDSKEIQKLKKLLIEFNGINHLPEPLAEAYHLAFRNHLMMCDLLLAFEEKDDHQVSAQSEKIFGKPSKYLLSTAEKTVGNPDTPIRLSRHADKKDLTSDELSNSINNRLQQYGVRWKLVLTNYSVSRVSVKPIQRVITVRQDLFFSPHDVKKILVHEVDTHVLRTENGKRCWTPGIFELGFYDSEKTDEGLALYNERLQNVSSPDSDCIIALHVLGIEYASSHTFSETFDWIINYFPYDPEFAFHRVLRWKRGLHHQDRPGVFYKDMVYFMGFFEVNDYITNGGKISNLYYGRTGLEQAHNDWLTAAKTAGFKPHLAPILPIWLSD